MRQKTPEGYKTISDLQNMNNGSHDSSWMFKHHQRALLNVLKLWGFFHPLLMITNNQTFLTPLTSILTFLTGQTLVQIHVSIIMKMSSIGSYCLLQMITLLFFNEYIKVLKKNYDQRSHYLSTLSHEFSIIAFSETWPTSMNSDLSNVPNYTSVLLFW